MARVTSCNEGESSASRMRAPHIFFKAATSFFFSETALSGYPGADMESFKGYDWEVLKEETLKVMDKAKKKNIPKP